METDYLRLLNYFNLDVVVDLQWHV